MFSKRNILTSSFGLLTREERTQINEESLDILVKEKQYWINKVETLIKEKKKQLEEIQNCRNDMYLI